MTMALSARDSQRLWTPPAALSQGAHRVALERPPLRPPTGADTLLLDQLRRLARAPRGWIALVLQLSQLPPPGARTHHRRIALALMQDNARVHEGQVFALSNGDLVLLGPARADPAALAQLLLRLLRAPAVLASLWPLDIEARRLHDELAARLEGQAETHGPAADTQGEPAAADPAPDETRVTDALGALVASLPVETVLHRQTALGVGDRLRPLFREISFSVAALEARLDLHDADADPFLFRHLASLLDRHLLAALTRTLGDGGPLDTAGHEPARQGPGTVPVHLNLTLSGILAPGFLDYARAWAATSAPGAAPPAIEIAFIEACADPAGFAEACARLARFGMEPVLDGVPHLALLLARPALFAPGRLKLDWSPRLAELSAAENAAIDRAIAGIGPHRIVLHRAETEPALHWGLARGIRAFQGRHLDAVQAAMRLTTCPEAAFCTLRQCRERAASGDRPGRTGCANPALLDAAVPESGLA